MLFGCGERRPQQRQAIVGAAPALPKAVTHVQRRFRKHRDDDEPAASEASRHGAPACLHRHCAERLLPEVGPALVLP